MALVCPPSKSRSSTSPVQTTVRRISCMPATRALLHRKKEVPGAGPKTNTKKSKAAGRRPIASAGTRQPGDPAARCGSQYQPPWPGRQVRSAKHRLRNHTAEIVPVSRDYFVVIAHRRPHDDDGCVVVGPGFAEPCVCLNACATRAARCEATSNCSLRDTVWSVDFLCKEKNA